MYNKQQIIKGKLLQATIRKCKLPYMRHYFCMAQVFPEAINGIKKAYIYAHHFYQSDLRFKQKPQSIY
jgi:hypothetical protein